LLAQTFKPALSQILRFTILQFFSTKRKFGGGYLAPSLLKPAQAPSSHFALVTGRAFFNKYVCLKYEWSCVGWRLQALADLGFSLLKNY
jgi:hypothetical protein